MKKKIMIFQFRIISISLLLMLFSSCAEAPPQQSLMDKPIPTTKAELDRECAAIRQEIVRQKAVVNYAYRTGNMYAHLIEIKAAKNIADLESRAAQIGCSSAFSSTVVQPGGASQSFDECFKRCKELTNRTNEECFDSCK